jgi:hypothetical protein
VNILNGRFWYSILCGNSTTKLYGFVRVDIVGVYSTEGLKFHRESFACPTKELFGKKDRISSIIPKKQGQGA